MYNIELRDSFMQKKYQIISFMLILYTGLANLTDVLPGKWTMFHKVEKVNFELYKNGNKINIYDYVKHQDFILRKNQYLKISEFICNKNKEDEFFVLDLISRKEYHHKDCKFIKI